MNHAWAPSNPRLPSLRPASPALRGLLLLGSPRQRRRSAAPTLGRRVARTSFFSRRYTFPSLLPASYLVRALFFGPANHSRPFHGEGRAQMRPQLHLLERMTLRACVRVLYGEMRSSRYRFKAAKARCDAMETDAVMIVCCTGETPVEEDDDERGAVARSHSRGCTEGRQ